MRKGKSRRSKLWKGSGRGARGRGDRGSGLLVVKGTGRVAAERCQPCWTRRSRKRGPGARRCAGRSGAVAKRRQDGGEREPSAVIIRGSQTETPARPGHHRRPRILTGQSPDSSKAGGKGSCLDPSPLIFKRVQFSSVAQLCLALCDPASGSFPKSPFFASGGQSTVVSTSASVLPMNTQD